MANTAYVEIAVPNNKESIGMYVLPANEELTGALKNNEKLADSVSLESFDPVIYVENAIYNNLLEPGDRLVFIYNPKTGGKAGTLYRIRKDRLPLPADVLPEEYANDMYIHVFPQEDAGNLPENTLEKFEQYPASAFLNMLMSENAKQANHYVMVVSDRFPNTYKIIRPHFNPLDILIISPRENEADVNRSNLILIPEDKVASALIKFIKDHELTREFMITTPDEYIKMSTSSDKAFSALAIARPAIDGFEYSVYILKPEEYRELKILLSSRENGQGVPVSITLTKDTKPAKDAIAEAIEKLKAGDKKGPDISASVSEVIERLMKDPNVARGVPRITVYGSKVDGPHGPEDRYIINMPR